MVEVIQNLLDNAAKFMGNQQNPEIQIRVRSTKNERIFFIADNGIGIEPVYQEGVFGLFNKLDANTEGTGIGHGHWAGARPTYYRISWRAGLG